MSSGAWSRLCSVDVERVEVGDAPVDLALIDDLARRALTARRNGRVLVIADPSPELADLLVLVGLADVLAGDRSWVEVRGQAEEREQARVEEVVEPGDATVGDLDEVDVEGLQ